MRTRALKMRPLLAGALLLAACAEKPAAKAAPPPREVEVLALTPVEVRDTGEYLGSLLSRQSVNVLPQVAGYVRRIHVRPGQKVAAGAPLVDVDARQESAALESAQAQRFSAEANLELAKKSLARAQTMHKEGLASAQELERAVAQADAAEAAARAAAAQVDQRQVQLQYFTVRAPIAGTVGDVLVRLGDFVGGTTQLTSLAQADLLELSVAVPAARARTLAAGTPVEVLDAAGEVLAEVPLFYVAPQADPRTQLVEVKAVLENRIGLRPSELVRARVVYSKRKALELPALSVVRQSGQAFAFVLVEKNGRPAVERRPVTLGALGSLGYVLDGGLAEGVRIAVSSIQALRDGMPVAPKPVQARSEVAAPAAPAPPAPADR